MSQGGIQVTGGGDVGLGRHSLPASHTSAPACSPRQGPASARSHPAWHRARAQADWEQSKNISSERFPLEELTGLSQTPALARKPREDSRGQEAHPYQGRG